MKTILKTPSDIRAAFRGEDGRWKIFGAPREIHIAHTLEDVAPLLEKVEAACDAGRWAGGYLAYDAASSFDAAMETHPGQDIPLAWFGIFDAPFECDSLPRIAENAPRAVWTPLVERGDYEAAVAAIREHIASGDAYQVNYTFPMRAAFAGDPWAWFVQLSAAQGAGPHAFLDTGRHVFLSVSPELFFALEGETLTTRPMKGTCPRGRFEAEDLALAQALAASEKERAENVMIVDLLRNDLGRVAETGSVEVPHLFACERYETVWQMTSTITARTRASLGKIFGALFPCGSVTGAPKIAAMRIIRALENHPRGIYCGAAGWCAPGRRAQFNVAIRTVTLDRATGEARYWAGSGITWDSAADAEYRECLDKAAVLDFERPAFHLLESLRYEREYLLLEEHLDRIASSARYFGFPCDRATMRARLLEHAAGLGDAPMKVRLLLARDGIVTVESAPAPASGRIRLGWARAPVRSSDVFLCHKTTYRSVYDDALAGRPDCDDVLLWNERGELTESTRANVVLELGGKRLTPPVECGLLAGTLRAALVRSGDIEEAVLRREEIARAERILLINSVRCWMEVEWIG